MSLGFNDISTDFLLILLVFFIIISGFFSGSETGMMSLNRYRLKHKAKTEKKARRILKLLARPDRLLGVILIGNNFVNISASSLATIICVRLFGEAGVQIAIVSMTVIVLIFAEITPKTLAAVKPETVADFCYLPLQILLWAMFPLVWLVNGVSNTLLAILGFKTGKKKADPLNLQEIKTVVTDASGYIPSQHQRMLTSILDLEKVSVDDIMIPRTEVIGIDIDDDIKSILSQLTHTQHTLLPVYKGEINHIIGILHTRDLGHIYSQGTLTITALKRTLMKPYFVPEGTSLHIQLLQFQTNKQRMGLVVDEYGDIQGLVTLADILEEIVGEFTTDTTHINQEIHPQPDGSYLIDGSAYIREINRALKWQLPTDGAKTIGGLITNYLETIPEQATCLKINGYPLEVVQVKDNAIKTVRFYRLPKST